MSGMSGVTVSVGSVASGGPTSGMTTSGGDVSPSTAESTGAMASAASGSAKEYLMSSTADESVTDDWVGSESFAQAEESSNTTSRSFRMVGEYTENSLDLALRIDRPARRCVCDWCEIGAGLALPSKETPLYR
ncbi:MAG: hypothetical protein ACI9OJ_004778 [Myxococcota bacterium]